MAEMFTTIMGALAGAAFYLTMNSMLTDYLTVDNSAEVTEPAPKDDTEAQYQQEAAERAPLMEALRKAREHEKHSPRGGGAMARDAAMPDSDVGMAHARTVDENSLRARSKDLWGKA